MITFRNFEEADAPLLVQYLNNKNVTQYLSARIPQPYEDKDANWWIGAGSKTVWAKAIIFEGVLIGSIGAVPGLFEREKSAEVGYWLAEPYWGKGFASHALAEFSDCIFNTTKITRLYSPVFSANKKSMRVLEKCGYKLEGILEKAIFKNGQYFNEHLYAKLKE